MGPEDVAKQRPMEETTREKVALRTGVAFWILGLCNNYGYVVMLSAAHDILTPDDGSKSNTTRDCNTLSTGVILLADIIPSLVIKVIAPFFPLWIHVRIILALILSSAGYILVAVSTTKTLYIGIMGVVCTALSSGLGEVSLLAYMPYYKGKTAISNWSSGTGGAGFFGSFTYLVLQTFLGPKNTLFALLTVPALMGVAFWIILEKPTESEIPEEAEMESSVRTFRDKIRYMPKLLKYMVPLGLVYLFEYFINQGLFELMTYDLSWLTHRSQYLWYQVDYQVGVFISRSSLHLFEINKIWLLALLQGLNVIFFTTEAIYTWLPHFSLAVIFVFFEGFFGGAAYVNTYNRISREIPPGDVKFAMSFTSLADSIGITLAGFIAMPVHNAICDLPYY